MIPKIIHFCWLSNDAYPEKIKYCIASWKKFLPDYEIILWNRDRFDINSNSWTKQAFELKKYAFAADYIRCYALYNYGGIYLDSDVEVLKSFDDLLHLPIFIGRDFSNTFEPAVIGCEKNHELFKYMLQYYKDREFIKQDGTMDTQPLPSIMEKLSYNQFSVIDIKSVSEYDVSPRSLNLFPFDYFSPKRQDNYKIIKSQRTYTIHHFEASWYSPKQKTFRLLSKIFGFKLVSKISSVLK